MNRRVDIDVESILDDTPRPVKDIWKRLDCWSPTSVQHALYRLAAAGKAVRGSEPYCNVIRNTYRKPLVTEQTRGSDSVALIQETEINQGRAGA